MSEANRTAYGGMVWLPGTEQSLVQLTLLLDQENREVSLNLDESSGGSTTWVGVNVHLSNSGLVFQTQGLPSKDRTLWWVLRRAEDGLVGLINTLPDEHGMWNQSTVSLSHRRPVTDS